MSEYGFNDNKQKVDVYTKGQIDALLTGLSAGGGVTLVTQHTTGTTLTVNNLNASTDKLLLFKNGMYLSNPHEYTIDMSTGVVTFSITNSANSVFDVVIFRNTSAGSSGLAAPLVTIWDNVATLVSPSQDDTAVTYYTVDGSNPTTESEEYLIPFEINPPCTIKAMTVLNGETSPVTTYQCAAPATIQVTGATLGDDGIYHANVGDVVTLSVVES